MKRVLLKGHAEVSLEGINYKPDAAGVFEVPDDMAHILFQHGGALASAQVPVAEVAKSKKG